jgi:hypothetical protein
LIGKAKVRKFGERLTGWGVENCYENEHFQTSNKRVTNSLTKPLIAITIQHVIPNSTKQLPYERTPSHRGRASLAWSWGYIFVEDS